jgi:hypothetical protein
LTIANAASVRAWRAHDSFSAYDPPREKRAPLSHPCG